MRLTGTRKTREANLQTPKYHSHEAISKAIDALFIEFMDIMREKGRRKIKEGETPTAEPNMIRKNKRTC